MRRHRPLGLLNRNEDVRHRRGSARVSMQTGAWLLNDQVFSMI